MSIRINLALEASEMFLSRHMIFSLERAAVVWATNSTANNYSGLLKKKKKKKKKQDMSQVQYYIYIYTWTD